MFNKIRRAFTGYKIKNISTDGIEIKISYRGKFPSTNPLALLKELKGKLTQTPNANVVDCDFSDPWKTSLMKVENAFPSCSVKFQIGDSKYKISRYVSKQSNSPLSIYSYCENEKIFAFFSRVYDHGIFFKEIEAELITNKGIKKSEGDINRYYISKDHYSAILDVFGHSQTFMWNDQEALDKLLRSLV